MIDKRLQYQSVGPEAILKTFQKLPSTQHSIQENLEKKKISIDSVSVTTSNPQVKLVITVHGEFLQGT
jgi:hypothetical protein